MTNLVSVLAILATFQTLNLNKKGESHVFSSFRGFIYYSLQRGSKHTHFYFKNTDKPNTLILFSGIASLQHVLCLDSSSLYTTTATN